MLFPRVLYLPLSLVWLVASSVLFGCSLCCHPDEQFLVVQLTCGSKVYLWAPWSPVCLPLIQFSWPVSLSMEELTTGLPVLPPTCLHLFSDFHLRQLQHGVGESWTECGASQEVCVRKQCQEGGRRMDNALPGPLAFNRQPSFQIFLWSSCNWMLPLTAECDECMKSQTHAVKILLQVRACCSLVICIIANTCFLSKA